jgi:hypothetical protein
VSELVEVHHRVAVAPDQLQLRGSARDRPGPDEGEQVLPRVDAQHDEGPRCCACRVPAERHDDVDQRRAIVADLELRHGRYAGGAAFGDEPALEPVDGAGARVPTKRGMAVLVKNEDGAVVVALAGHRHPAEDRVHPGGAGVPRDAGDDPVDEGGVGLDDPGVAEALLPPLRNLPGLERDDGGEGLPLLVQRLAPLGTDVQIGGDGHPRDQHRESEPQEPRQGLRRRGGRHHRDRLPAHRLPPFGRRACPRGRSLASGPPRRITPPRRDRVALPAPRGEAPGSGCVGRTASRDR